MLTLRLCLILFRGKTTERGYSVTAQEETENGSEQLG
ncbi:hypothetical protein EniLVp02_0063 [Vibrio phage EniLVp02]